MDLELLKLYKEYEELNNKITPLRIEYNFLIEDIRVKRKEQEVLDNRKKVILLEQEEGRNKLNLEKERFSLYEMSKREELENKLTREKKDIERLIGEQKYQKEQMDINQKKYDKEITEFEAYKKQEEDKIELSYQNINIEKQDLLDKQQNISIESLRIESLLNEAKQIKSDNDKLLKAIKERESKLEKIEIDIKKQFELLSATQFVLENKEKDITEREQKVSDKEQMLKKQQVELDKKQLNLKEKEDNQTEKGYNLSMKEADLGIEEKRLILLAKKLQNG